MRMLALCVLCAAMAMGQGAKKEAYQDSAHDLSGIKPNENAYEFPTTKETNIFPVIASKKQILFASKSITAQTTKPDAKGKEMVIIRTFPTMFDIAIKAKNAKALQSSKRNPSPAAKR